MSDVLFRYLLTARQRDESVFRRLVLADEPLLEAGVEQLVETAAVRVQVTSQHERTERRRDTVPASRHRRVHFYDAPEPRRPQDGHFEERSEEFPLRDTLNIYTCTDCRGAGKVRCRTCSGRGKTGCTGCGGSGKVQNHKGRRRRCGTCGGSGRQRCFSCQGSGMVTCRTCRGEGQLASWEAEVFHYLIERRSADEYPPAAQEARIHRTFERWLGIEPDQVANLERATVAEHLGFETPEALAVIAQADTKRREMEQEAQRSTGRFLFLRTDPALSPVGYTVVRLDGKARYYWLIGRGEKALEVLPRGRADGWKCAGWLGLGSGSAMAYEAVAQTYSFAQPVLEMLAATQVPVSWLITGSAASWLMTLRGVRRVRLRRPPVSTIGLIVPSGRPTAFLTCLAYLGSYLERLKVLDRAYDAQSDELLGRMRSKRQSQSLSLELPDGHKVRLVELARSHRLSDSQLLLMAQALDGVMILEEPEQNAAELVERITKLAKPSPNITRLRIDSEAAELRDPPLSPVGDRGLPLAGIRRAFVGDMQRAVDWDTLYQQMWQPLAGLLENGRLENDRLERDRLERDRLEKGLRDETEKERKA